MYISDFISGSGWAVDACGVCGGTNLCKLDPVTVTLGRRRATLAAQSERNDSKGTMAWSGDRTEDIFTEDDGGQPGATDRLDQADHSSFGPRSTSGGVWWQALLISLAAAAWSASSLAFFTS